MALWWGNAGFGCRFRNGRFRIDSQPNLKTAAMKKTQTIIASLILAMSLFASQTPAWAEEPAEPLASVININTATAEELTALDGIGESKALAIVADRDTNGPFESEGDLTRVRGIGEATVEKNAERITTR